MAKKFKDHVVRDKPKKRGARQHKKTRINQRKDSKNNFVIRAKVKAKNNLFYLLTYILCYPICIGH